MKRLLFVADGGKAWIGGLYYVKNMLFGLMNAIASIEQKPRILVAVTHENYDVFRSFENCSNIELVTIDKKKPSLAHKAIQLLTCRAFDKRIASLVKKYDIDWVFPVVGRPYIGIEEKCIFWIPDFQFMHYPQYFTKAALFWKESTGRFVAKKGYPIILSSNVARIDFETFFPGTHNVSVVPFVSYLDDYETTAREVEKTCLKFEINESFYLCANQFWAHKNHKVVFEALAELKKRGSYVPMVVFTGNTTGGRGETILQELQSYARKNEIEDRIKVLGFVDRLEQLDLMSASMAVIQPSLFEGWGTVFEDAKALSKRVILSDIPIHREQDEGSAIFFDPHSPRELTLILETPFKREHEPGRSISTIQRSTRYATPFLNLIGNSESNNYPFQSSI